MFTPPSWSAFFGGFLHNCRFLPISSGWNALPGNPPERRKVPGIAPLKRIQNVSFRPFFPYSRKTSLLFCLLRRFPCLVGINTPLKRKSPLRGFLGLIRAYCILRHRKRRFPWRFRPFPGAYSVLIGFKGCFPVVFRPARAAGEVFRLVLQFNLIEGWMLSVKDKVRPAFRFRESAF